MVVCEAGEQFYANLSHLCSERGFAANQRAKVHPSCDRSNSGDDHLVGCLDTLTFSNKAVLHRPRVAIDHVGTRVFARQAANRRALR